MGIHRQSTFQAVSAWVLSLLMLCSPVLAQAHAWQPMPEPVSVAGDMPCHQELSLQTSQPACTYCDESGMSLLCDCCEQALSPSLLNESTIQAGLFSPRGDVNVRAPLSRPDPPPTDLYRPPIHS
jgi:hypothetical protein